MATKKFFYVKIDKRCKTNVRPIMIKDRADFAEQKAAGHPIFVLHANGSWICILNKNNIPAGMRFSHKAEAA